jgi:hypothetical protein
VTAVVLILDRSLSMPMNDFFYPARAKAIELINGLSQPGCPDHLQALITVGTRAGVTDPADLPDLEYDYEYGSNLDEALRLAVAELNGDPGRVVLISDLVGTAHTSPDGGLVFSSPPSPDTLDRTTEAIRLCAEQAISVEAWRYHNLGSGGRDDSRVIRESILATGGKVQDVPVDSPGHPTGWTEEEQEIIAEAERQGVRGYFQIRGTRETDPETLAERRRHRARLASEIVDGLRAKKRQGTLSDREQQALETAEAWLQTFDN